MHTRIAKRDALRSKPQLIQRTPISLNTIKCGGIQDSEVLGGNGNPTYTAALQVLDSDMPQYIHDNTDDEITHFTFLNAYLILLCYKIDTRISKPRAGKRCMC